METTRNNVNHSEVQRLERKKRYETRCAIRQRDENARAIRENDYLQTFIKEYESLARIQGATRPRMDEICAQETAQNRKKKTYDAVYRIEAEKVR